jgi:hypothetical protein
MCRREASPERAATHGNARSLSGGFATGRLVGNPTGGRRTHSIPEGDAGSSGDVGRGRVGMTDMDPSFAAAHFDVRPAFTVEGDLSRTPSVAIKLAFPLRPPVRSLAYLRVRVPGDLWVLDPRIVRTIARRRREMGGLPVVIEADGDRRTRPREARGRFHSLAFSIAAVWRVAWSAEGGSEGSLPPLVVIGPAAPAILVPQPTVLAGIALAHLARRARLSSRSLAEAFTAARAPAPDTRARRAMIESWVASGLVAPAAAQETSSSARSRGAPPKEYLSFPWQAWSARDPADRRAARFDPAGYTAYFAQARALRRAGVVGI